MRNPLVYLLLICVSFFTSLPLIHSQEIISLDQIDPVLKKNANAIIHYDDYVVEIIKADKVRVKNSYAVTVLNKKGSRFLDFVSFEKERSRKIKDVRVEYFDGDGNLLKQIDKKDLTEQAYDDGVKLISDFSIKSYSFTANNYPVVVKCSYEIESRNTEIISWYPIPSYNTAVISSSYKIFNQAGLKIKSRSNFDEFENIEQIGSFHFKASNLPAVMSERYSKSINKFPKIEFESNPFVYEGHTCEADNWEEFGKWVYDDLLSGEDFEDIALYHFARSIVSDTTDKRKIAEEIFKYVQENTRYINVSLDDGGVVPIDFMNTHELKYGDCKGLAFYTQALLAQFDINSDYVHVQAGDSKVSFYNDFHSLSQGNHAIIRINLPGDTIWADCTMHNTPFGFLDDFTDDRQVLLMSENGGRLAYTPEYGLELNTRYTNATIRFSDDAAIHVESDYKLTGIGYNTVKILEAYPDKYGNEYLEENLLRYFKNIEIQEINFQFQPEEIKSSITQKFSAKGHHEIYGDYILIPIRTFDLNIPYLPKSKTRLHDIEFQRSYLRSNKIEYEIPDGYRYDNSSFSNKTLNSKYGTYTVDIIEQDDKVIVISSFQLNKGLYPKSEYKEIKSFFDRIRKTERIQFSLTKKS